MSQDDSRKLLLPDGIPESEDELIEKVREAFGLNGRFRLQYQDKDFGDIFVNLTNTGEIQSLGTLRLSRCQTKTHSLLKQMMGTQSNDDACPPLALATLMIQSSSHPLAQKLFL